MFLQSWSKTSLRVIYNSFWGSWTWCSFLSDEPKPFNSSSCNTETVKIEYAHIWYTSSPSFFSQPAFPGPFFHALRLKNRKIRFNQIVDSLFLILISSRMDTFVRISVMNIYLHDHISKAWILLQFAAFIVHVYILYICMYRDA